MGVFVNNTRVPVGDRISLRFFNPLFNDITAHSFPVSFNARIPEVKRAFGFPGEIDAQDSGLKIEGRIRTGVFDISGEWEITDATSNRIEAYFKGNSGAFYSLIGNKLLTSMEFGGMKYPAGALASIAEVLAHMDTKMNASYPDDDYAAFCAYMPNAYGEGETDAVYKWVNEVEWDVNGDPSFKDKGGNSGNDTVYLFAGTVIDYIFAEFGYKINRNVFRTDARFQKLVVFNTYNRTSSSGFDYSKLVPPVNISEFLKAITNRFNIGFFVNETNKSVDIIFFDDLLNPGVKDLASKWQSRPVIDSRRTTGMKFPLNAPDTWSQHSINGTADFAPYTPTEVYKLRDILPGPLTLGNVYFVKAESAYYRVVYKDSEYLAARICMRNFPYNPGSGGTEVTQYSGIPGMYTHVYEWSDVVMVWDPELQTEVPVTYETDVDIVMPRCDLEATDYAHPNTGFPIMFLFARGVMESYIVPAEGAPETLKYPLGSNDIYDAEGSVIAGADMALNWNEDNGLIGNFWDNRINWELNLKKLVKGDLPPDDINELLNFAQAVRIENSNYLASVVNVELVGEQVSVEEAEMLRL